MFINVHELFINILYQLFLVIYLPYVLGVAALKITRNFITKIIRTRGGKAFDNFLIQFSYNFEAVGRPLFLVGVAALKTLQNLFQNLLLAGVG